MIYTEADVTKYIAEHADIEKLRDRVVGALSKDADALRLAALSKLDRLLRMQSDITPDKLATLLSEDFVLAPSETKTLAEHLRQGQNLLAARRTELLTKYVDVPDIDFDNLQALYRVNFPKVAEGVRNQVVELFRKVHLDGGGTSDLLALLRERKVASGTARTLSRTALAQFDNAYTVDLARQGGIEYFRYSGAPPERDFCKSHFEQVYTIESIRKMSNGQGLDVLTSCGGYNCQHYWIAFPFANIPKK